MPIVGNAVYYGTLHDGSYVSFDNGYAWLKNNNGLRHGPTTLPSLIKDFAVDNEYIYAATDLGVFRQRLQGAPTSINIEGPRFSLSGTSVPLSSTPNETISVFDTNGRAVPYRLSGRPYIVRLESGRRCISVIFWTS